MIRLFAAALLGMMLAATPRFAVADEIRIGEASVVVSGPLVAQPRAASGDGIYLVVWQDGWSGIDATADIKGIRLRAGTLEPLDREPITICAAAESQEAPVTAYAEGVFLVVWQDFRNGKHYGIRGLRIDARTGEPRGDEIVIAGGSATQCRPAVASDGKTFWVVWQSMRGQDTYAVRGLRISPAGKVLDEAAHDYAAAGTSPAIGCSEGKVLVAWTIKQRNQARTAAALVDPATGRKTHDLGAINTCCGDGVAVAADGQGNLLTVASRASAPDPWGWGGRGAVVLSRVLADASTPESKLDYAYRLSKLCSRSVPNVVDAALWKGAKTWEAGAPGGFPGTEDGWWPTGSPTAAHDGKKTYLFAWVKGKLQDDRLNFSRLDIWIRGMDGQSLAVRVADRKVAADAQADHARPVLVNGPQGETLLLYERLKAGEDRRLLARRITADE